MGLDWIKSIPDHQKYFNKDHQLIISLIGIDNYIKLYLYFGKTGVYFPVRRYEDSDMDIIIKLIGEENYNKLYDSFSKSGIFFSSSPIIHLKKVWVNQHRNIDYKLAARTLDISVRAVYKWRAANCETIE